MKVEQTNWKIKELIDEKDKIDLNPEWQRGPAWKAPRQVLLIDSILRGMDIPKIYFRKLGHKLHDYDAVDGQQRLRAIWGFHADEIVLRYSEPLRPIGHEKIEGRKFSELSKTLRDRFEDFTVSIGEITVSRPDEIRNLFARLQMGVSLNPAELRNAMDGPLRYSIDSTARLHQFFKYCKISPDRYKHLDYAAHLYAMVAYDGDSDIKAPDLRNMISEYGADRGLEVLSLSEKVDNTLTVLNEVNSYMGFSLIRKWPFVDLSWLIMQLQMENKQINAKKIAEKFLNFEDLRLRYNAHPEKLFAHNKMLGMSDALAKNLYNYINAFKVQGGLKANLQIRNKALRAFLK
jgi:hypothetical protein